MRSLWRMELSALVIATGLLTFSACRVTSHGGPSDPSDGSEPEVLNNTDDFDFRWANLTDFTGNRQYSWVNTGPSASVTQTSSGLTSADSVKLIIRNSSGTEVYRGDLRVIGNYQTATTTGGTYTIRIEIRNAGGTIDFRLLKRN